MLQQVSVQGSRFSRQYAMTPFYRLRVTRTLLESCLLEPRAGEDHMPMLKLIPSKKGGALAAFQLL